MEEEASVVCVREIKATPQDHVEEIVVVAETETEKVSVDMLEVFEGVEALENEFLDLQTLGNWRRCWPAQHAYSRQIAFIITIMHGVICYKVLIPFFDLGHPFFLSFLLGM